MQTQGKRLLKNRIKGTESKVSDSPFFNDTSQEPSEEEKLCESYINNNYCLNETFL